jgi:hypothetical protein
MTQDDCKLITEKLLGECWHEGYWYCPYCKMEVSSQRVTYEEQCDTCLQYVTWEENRTFQDPQDFFACFEKLVELGEWKRFLERVILKGDTYDLLGIIHYNADAIRYLNSRTESGHYRLCQLTANYLKEKEKNNG